MFFMKKLLSFEAAFAGDSDVRVLSPGFTKESFESMRLERCIWSSDFSTFDTPTRFSTH